MAEQTQEDILRFENVSLSFGDLNALKDVSFGVKAGETRIIFGAAGSGKSVLLKIALGLLKPTRGEVYLFGQEITELQEEDLFPIRSKIGVLFQEGGLFDSMTINENVSYPLLNRRFISEELSAEEVSRRVREVLRFVELEHTLEKFPSELSGGMRRRVGIARAAVTGPPLILYDSPTAGLDPITANTIIALIVKERDTKNTTSMIVTHRYQDGHLLANFRYNPQSEQIEPIATNGSGGGVKTTFMVFREGGLVFQGAQDDLEAASDPYISKFKSVKS